MKTLPDYIDHDLKILSIGLNPSTISVEKGYYFANPRNRFWKAFNACGLAPIQLTPSKEAHEKLVDDYKIGFTDVVKRHSSMGRDLQVADYKLWAPILNAKIKKYQPWLCWFHGKVAMQNFLKHTGYEKREVVWGEQVFKIENSFVFVTPNPSPANAIFSLEDITHWYTMLYNKVQHES